MQAFFLPAADGSRFCVYHPPAGPVRCGVVFVQPFAEEMNKSRHVVAQAARQMAAQGVGVLLIDLKGCGDSSGAFDDGTWDDWRSDVHLATRFMRERGHDRLALWGLRLGALLAAQCAAEPTAGIERCVFWQPVLQSEMHLVQFLRLRLAGAMFSGGKSEETGKTLRARLAAGESIEVAGYRLSPAMAATLSGLDMTAMRPTCPVSWIEIVAEGQQGIPPATSRVIDAWRDRGTAVDLTTLAAEPFWAASNAAELVQCPAIVEATARQAQAWF